MTYEKVNGYSITPYDVDGKQCYALRDGKIGYLIRNSNGLPIILRTKEQVVGVALELPECSKLATSHSLLFEVGMTVY